MKKQKERASITWKTVGSDIASNAGCIRQRRRSYDALLSRIETRKNSFCRSMFGLLAVVTLLGGQAHADSFEFLTYTPPRGWVNLVTQDGSVYRRTSGIGLITFYASYPATGAAPDEFVRR